MTFNQLGQLNGNSAPAGTFKDRLQRATVGEQQLQTKKSPQQGGRNAITGTRSGR